jgi:phosphotransacetylase
MVDMDSKALVLSVPGSMYKTLEEYVDALYTERQRKGRKYRQSLEDVVLVAAMSYLGSRIGGRTRAGK